MRNILKRFFLPGAALVLGIALSSCSKNEENIAAPEFIINQPVENEIIDLKSHDVIIDVKAKAEHGNLCCMEMYVYNESNIRFFNDTKDNIKDHDYECYDALKPSGITKLTKLTLYVRFTNEFGDFKEGYRNFYVEP